MSPATTSAFRSSHWQRNTVVGVALFAVLGIASGAVYQVISAARDRRDNPMPGELVEVGGYKMHIYCAGEGTPAVILESGLGDPFIRWREVQPQIAQFTRACSYDRAGLGYSDPSPRSRTSKDIAQELHTLLHNDSIPQPIVLVGHSMGGYDVRVYTSLYRNEVAGMVLVDSSHPEQQNRFPAALNELDRSMLRKVEQEQFTMPFGLPRLFGFFDPFYYCHTTAAARAVECNLHSVREGIAELKSFPESASQAAISGSLGDIPLSVLMHDPDQPEHLLPNLPPDINKQVNDEWGKMQRELAQLSSRGTLTVAKNSGHYIQLERPDVVVEAVRSVVEQVRRGLPTQNVSQSRE